MTNRTENTDIQPTARFTWRDLVGLDATLRGRCRLYDVTRDQLPFEDEDLRSDCVEHPDYGGLLAWNLTRDEEGGHLFMFTGQTATRERQVLDNAAWLASCGAVYAASRVGMKAWKRVADHRCTVDGDEYLVWLLSNDESMRSL